jgi:hypothetical protein
MIVDSNTDLFLHEWDKQLQDLSFILDFLNTYPQIIKQIGLDDLLTSDELIKSQLDWVKICSQYEGMEKEFFKPFWAPIQKSTLSYFIDLSNQKYPIFKYGFVFFEPYSYERMDLFNSIDELMLLGDSNTDIEGIKNDYKDKWFEFYCRKSFDQNKK